MSSNLLKCKTFCAGERAGLRQSRSVMVRGVEGNQIERFALARTKNQRRRPLCVTTFVKLTASVVVKGTYKERSSPHAPGQAGRIAFCSKPREVCIGRGRYFMSTCVASNIFKRRVAWKN